MATPSKFDLPQGTLDLLILRVVALGPVHGYAIAQRIHRRAQCKWRYRIKGLHHRI